MTSAYHIAHTPPATVAEVRAVLEMFPKCTTCGQPLDCNDAVPDGTHAFRMRHRGPCPTCAPLPPAA